MQTDIALIGLAVMGQNLVLNFADKGYCVGVFNRTQAKTDAFMEQRAKGRPIIPAYSLEELISRLKKPRRLMLMVQAGLAVDTLIEQCLPHLEPGDIIIDGGNSDFHDSQRRSSELEKKNILFVGMGVSGGEEGARWGPSVMPGGNEKAWPHIKEVFQKVSASFDGVPCCFWLGQGGAGHFVKMVHNGIEYADMQLIAESYHVLKEGLGLSSEEIAFVFDQWNEKELKSYLISITSKILSKKEGGCALIEKILDVAQHKGTGMWTALASLDLSVGANVLSEAVFCRYLSSEKDLRLQAADLLEGPRPKIDEDKKQIISWVFSALYASKIVAYCQGFLLMQRASQHYGWNLDMEKIALSWREGCIIRSVFLDKIAEAYRKNPDLNLMILDDFFQKELKSLQTSWRQLICKMVEKAIPSPCFSASLNFYDTMRCKLLPSSLIQAQRDFFGAHTYERIDSARGKMFHTDWEGS